MSCSVQPTNSLRYDCDVTQVPPYNPVRIGHRKTGHVKVRWFGWNAGAATTSETLYNFEPDYAYDVVVEEDTLSGPVLTAQSLGIPTLPADLADLNFQTTYDGVDHVGSSATEYVLFNTESCPEGPGKRRHLVVYRIAAPGAPDGYIAWYHSVEDETSGGEYTGFSLSEEGTVLSSVDKQVLYEWDFTGALLQSEDHSGKCSGATGDEGPCPHHDVKRSALGTVWAVSAQLDATAASSWAGLPCTARFVNDGVQAAFGTGVQSAWLMDDMGFDPSVDPGPRDEDVACDGKYWEGQFEDPEIDWTHLNAVSPMTVAGSYDVLHLSLREFDEILRYVPTSGALVWQLSGWSGRGDFSLVLAPGLGGTADFHGQHDITWTNGGVVFLDNRTGEGGTQSVVGVVPDGGSGTATMDRRWVLTDAGGDPLIDCTSSGGAQLIPGTAGGKVLAVCKQLNRIMELHHADGSLSPPKLALELVTGAECQTSGKQPIQGWYRAYPVVDVGAFR